MEVFRGDSWQFFCPKFHVALARGLIFRNYLFGRHGIETRIAIGIGTVDSLKLEKISLSQGEAFVLSGQSLNSMPSDRRLTIATGDDVPSDVSSLLTASCTLLDALSQNWTSKQSLAVALTSKVALDSNNTLQNELATQFIPPISAQAFGKHLARAQWKFVKTALESISSGVSSSLPHSNS